MAAFKDRHGREWTFELTTWDLRALKLEAGEDLGKLTAGDFSLVNELLSDSSRVLNVLYTLCKEQREKLGVTDEQFGRSLVGDSYWDAVDALKQAIVDFFRSGHKEIVAKLWEKERQVRELMLVEVERQIESLSPTTIVSAMNSPPLSELKPGNTP